MNRLSNAPFLVRLIISIVLIFGLFYVNLPPVNLRSPQFWFFIMQCIIVCIIANFFGAISEVFERGTRYGELNSEDLKYAFGGFAAPLKYAVAAVAVIFGFLFLGKYLQKIFL